MGNHSAERRSSWHKNTQLVRGAAQIWTQASCSTVHRLSPSKRQSWYPRCKRLVKTTCSVLPPTTVCAHKHTRRKNNNGVFWVTDLWVMFTPFLSLLSKFSTWNMFNFRKRFIIVKWAAFDPLVPPPFPPGSLPWMLPPAPTHTHELCKVRWGPECIHTPRACPSRGQGNLPGPTSVYSTARNTLTAVETARAELNGHSQGWTGKWRPFLMGVYHTNIKIMFTTTLGTVYAGTWNE